MQKKIISHLGSKEDFMGLLEMNPGLIIIKLGATWCGPCKRIAPKVDEFFATSPDNVICADLDVDECVDIYSVLKRRRIVNGIPVILCYKRGTRDVVPDDSVTGGDPAALSAFFARCATYLK